MSDQKVICRFCLDGGVTKRNPLFTPCLCNGSMKYVHVLCLDKWRVMDMDRNGSYCGLCLAEYTSTQHPFLEVIPTKDSYSSLLLRMPLVPAFILHYMYIIPFSASKEVQQSFTYDKYVAYQLLFQFSYLVLFLTQIQVKNKKEYYTHWRQKESLMLFMTHLTLLVSMFTRVGMAGISLDMFLGLYWIRHCQILQNINEKIMLEE